MVSQLLDHVEALEARIAELEGQQKPPREGVKERKPPSKANRPARPKQERKKRAHGFARRREEPTHRVEHARASCPDCGIPLPGGRVRGRHQIISIPQVQARVTEHVALERTCPKCRQRWSPAPPGPLHHPLAYPLPSDRRQGQPQRLADHPGQAFYGPPFALGRPPQRVPQNRRRLRSGAPSPSGRTALARCFPAGEGTPSLVPADQWTHRCN